MGCWYETCGLSGLPIPPGTPSLLFLLRRGTSIDDGRSGFCYPVGLWSPLTLPFRGKYDDDRGTLDFPKKAPVHWGVTKELLGDRKMVWKDDRYEQPEAPLEATYDYEKFFYRVERGWVSRSGHRGMEPVGQVLIRADVWEYLVGLKFEPFWGESSQAKNHEHAQALVTYLVKHPVKGLRDAFAVERKFQEERSSFLTSVFEPGESGASFGMYRSLLMHGLVEGRFKPEVALEIFREIGDVAHVNQVLYGLRRAWRPQPGKGSQDIEWELHEGFARKVAELAEGCRKEDEEGL